MSLASEAEDTVDKIVAKFDETTKRNGFNYDEKVAKDPDSMRALYKLASSLKLTGSGNQESPREWFYGVYIPRDVRLQSGEEPPHVYTVKEEALKVMKLSKKARFKQFRTYQEAEEFAEHGAEIIPNSTPTQTNAEKHSSFVGPKQQAIVQFKKAIDSGDIDAVRSAISENPRYLVSSGDTPSILQEGCRYNALHIAAKKNQAAITELILSSVTSLELLARLYDEADENALRERSAVLLDLYLNTPDKGCNDTPLHIACKFGAVDVVELLLSYPECRRDLTNKYHETPKDVACSREGNEATKAKILDLLEEKFFLPVLRSEDNSIQPTVGSPFSPIKPLEVEKSPLSPRIEIQAYAGPMTNNQLKEFRKKWRTPPAKLKASRLCDPEKGLERVGREIAHGMKVPWREYWSFLNTFVDLSSEEGLQMLEKYLEERFKDTFNLSMHESEAEGDEDVLSPVSHLCHALQACTLNETHAQRPLRINTKKIRREKSFLMRTEEVAEEIGDGQAQFSPLLCVERSCKVFGTRIANAMMCLSTSDPTSANVATEMLHDNLETEIRHLQALITGYLEDSRFHSVDFSLVHRRVTAIAVNGIREISPSGLITLTHCLKDISLADGTVSDDEDFRYSYRPNDRYCLRAVLKLHLLCMTECLLNELSLPSNKETNPVQTESECEVLWSSTCPCVCQWAADTDPAKAKAAWRRKPRILPKALNFGYDDEPSSIEESWRSCEEHEVDVDTFITPPSSPPPEEPLEETFSMPDTFIYPSDAPTKTDLAVLEAIKDCDISALSHPNIYRWRHLVQLHQDKFVTEISTPNRLNLSVSRSGGKEPKSPSTPVRAHWERVTGMYSPRRRDNLPR